MLMLQDLFLCEYLPDHRGGGGEVPGRLQATPLQGGAGQEEQGPHVHPPSPGLCGHHQRDQVPGGGGGGVLRGLHPL